MASTLKSLPFSPFFTGPALYLLTQAPSNLQQPLLEQLSQVLNPQNVNRLVTVLKWLFAAGLVRTANHYLSQWANNNFHLSGSTKGWNWDQEIAVVTGGSSGFGALYARDLSAKGIHVVALDLNELPKHLQDNPKITFFKCDVSDHDAVMEVASKIQSSIGHPSIVINNAGIGAGKSIMKTSPEYLKKIFGVNLYSHYWTVQAFLPHMVEQKKGHIISIASAASFVSTARIVDYSCTKVAALAFHEGLNSELRTLYKCPEIKTTIVHPIWADTPLIAQGKEALKKSGQLILDPQVVSDAVVKQIMTGRSGQIILAGGLGSVISSLRGFPTWLQESLRRLTEYSPNNQEQISKPVVQ